MLKIPFISRLLKKIYPYMSRSMLPSKYFSFFHPLLLSLYPLFEGKIDRRTFFYFDKEELIYLETPKNACSSILKSLLKLLDESNKIDFINSDQTRIHGKPKWNKTDNLKNREDYFKFTFVRNPFSRIVSCYQDKVKKHRYYYKYYLYGYLKVEDSFEEFIRKISKIPTSILEVHFNLQYSLIFENGKPLVDYIGKFETLEENFEFILKRYNLEKLEHRNKSIYVYKKWQDYYTKKIAKMIYIKYRKDFDTWYPDAYGELMNYLDDKEKCVIK